MRRRERACQFSESGAASATREQRPDAGERGRSSGRRKVAPGTCGRTGGAGEATPGRGRYGATLISSTRTVVTIRNQVTTNPTTINNLFTKPIGARLGPPGARGARAAKDAAATRRKQAAVARRRQDTQ